MLISTFYADRKGKLSFVSRVGLNEITKKVPFLRNLMSIKKRKKRICVRRV